MIYRARVLKQPDAVLALFLRHERFSLAEKMRNFRFYEPLTTGDSSLSHCIQSVMAAECGLVEKAYDYFLKTVRMDLDDVHGNSRDGVHIAAMAGSWISAVYGFAGMREGRERLSFRPELPAKWDRLAFTLAYRGRKLACEYRRESTAYELRGGEELEIEHEGTRHLLTPGRAPRSTRGRGRELDLRPRWRHRGHGIPARARLEAHGRRAGPALRAGSEGPDQGRLADGIA